MRRLVLGLCICAAVSLAAAGQQPTFKSGVSLVTVDVAVLDKDGRPVPGLTSEDFDIKLNGKPQAVRALVYVQAEAAPALAPKNGASAPAPPPVSTAPLGPLVISDTRQTWSNQDASAFAPETGASSRPAAAAPAVVAPDPSIKLQSAEPRVFVLLIDDLSYSATRGKAMFLAAQRFVDKVPASDPVGFATTSGVASANPTLDRIAIKSQLSRVTGSFVDPRGVVKNGPANKNPGSDSPLGISESIDIERGDETLLKDAITRECFNGDRSRLSGVSVAELLATNDCAQQVFREARSVGAQSRQTRGRQMDGIKSVIDAMRVAAGIRHLVLLSDGLALSRDVEELTPLVKSAAAAGVQISVLVEDPDASMNDVTRGDPGLEATHQVDVGARQRRREDDRLFMSGVQTMSDMLGGNFYRIVGSPDTAFEKVIIASSAVYRLGVELPSGLQPGKEVSLGVSLRRQNFTVRANRLAVYVPASASPAGDASARPSAPAPPPVMTPVPVKIDDVLKEALNASAVHRALPLRIAASVRRSATVGGIDGQVDVAVNVAMPSNVKGPLATMIGVLDETGTMKVSFRAVDPGAIVPYLFPLPPGNYKIRLAAADPAGTLGTVDVAVSARPRDMGPFTSSDVLTWTADGNRARLFTIDDVPAGAQTLNASLELYSVGPMPDEPPSVQWTVTREGAATPAFPLIDEENIAHPGQTLFRADLEIPWDTLPPGTYTVRATVLVKDKPTGTTAAIVRKR